jgi:hypothetical protein
LGNSLLHCAARSDDPPLPGFAPRSVETGSVAALSRPLLSRHRRPGYGAAFAGGGADASASARSSVQYKTVSSGNVASAAFHPCFS